MTDNFIEVYYTIKQFNGSELHYCGNSAPVMNGKGWEAKQMQWENDVLYVLWERKKQNQ